MRIEQAKHLNSLYAESVGRNIRFGLRQFLVITLFPTAVVLGLLAHNVCTGKPAFRWQWLAAATIGIQILILFKAITWLGTTTDRFAEIRDGKVRLGTIGYTFRSALLVSCSIESDSNFPEVSRICFCFRIYRFTRPLYWSIMVGDLDTAEAFRHELLERKGSKGDILI